MYLKVLIEVTNAKRPSFIIDETQLSLVSPLFWGVVLIESILHVNGGAIEAIEAIFTVQHVPIQIVILKLIEAII